LTHRFTHKLRQRWLKVLAEAPADLLEKAWQDVEEKPACTYLRPPETGMVMVRARTGGTGQPFNLGEMTVSRCTVKIETGQVGCGYAMGTNHRQVELIALFDALLQDSRCHSKLLNSVVAELEILQKNREETTAKKTASTKVDFFTMVRGD